ncbi:intracellular proteinase inhibitor [Neobacillus sp. PS3-40]|uniref:intracellular proteinase inhibitor n=1 Tax=Neobacillus sp. PS3-40 TaxID=3070679 RepID=UPI0027DEDCD1|nr:intracellular proteinase inhibitor [Neobacillus sp. PS3-40]WML43351.1 intracellular proteinase inhibitor [Neobacillus sp. PS3-40]
MLSLLFSFLLSISCNIPFHSIDVVMTNRVIPTENNAAFRHIHVHGNKGVYLITGETNLISRVVFYSVEDGHVEFIHEKKLSVKKKSQKWTSFKIRMEIPNSKLPRNGSLILNLYERTSKGVTVHPYSVILEEFYD